MTGDRPLSERETGYALGLRIAAAECERRAEELQSSGAFHAVACAAEARYLAGRLRALADVRAHPIAGDELCSECGRLVHPTRAVGGTLFGACGHPVRPR